MAAERLDQAPAGMHLDATHIGPVAQFALFVLEDCFNVCHGKFRCA
jgi:hypothetical protein